MEFSTAQRNQMIKEALELSETDGSGKHTLPLQLYSPRRVVWQEIWCVSPHAPGLRLTYSLRSMFAS